MRRLLPVALPLALATLVAASPAPAHEGHCITPQPTDLEGSGLRVEPLARFHVPTHVAAAPGDRRRLFVVERTGRVRVMRGGKLLRRPFLDLRREVRPTMQDPPEVPNERGMFSIAFPRDYRTSRRFYVFHSGRRGDGTIEEFRRSRRNPDRAVRSSRRVVFRQRHFLTKIHYGGHMAFGPDRRLYISLGDGLKRSAVQDRRQPYGKLISIDPRRPGRHRVHALGLRNPFRFSIDPQTRRIAIADVGENSYEEVNILAPGTHGNFGWPLFEGPERIADGTVRNHLPPALALHHDDGWHAVTGGHVVRDRRLPSIDGRYLYGDFCDGAVHSAVLGESGATDPRPLGITIPRLTAFGHDARGRIVVVSMAGWIGRVVADPAAS